MPPAPIETPQISKSLMTTGLRRRKIAPQLQPTGGISDSAGVAAADSR
ncbi:MAG: hypothetical protein GY820_03365 [Gammaproteobacteria bacterium]|nr:hypothetical protein [Gammaproteobacteria bacterium]